MINFVKKIVPLNLLKKFRRCLRESFKREAEKQKPKIFGIGNNKTGTTSLRRAMIELGYVVGDQKKAELLHKDWGARNFSVIADYCKTAQFFQDIPFSKPFTFVAMDQAFPKSKFILTVRNDAEQWYQSLVKFHTKIWGKNGNPPTAADLAEVTYNYKGWAFEMNRLQCITPLHDLYNKDLMIKSYNNHNENVINYFRNRTDDLLVLNVSEKGAYRKLCEFIGKPVTKDEFPWENKTSTIKDD